ncbi:MAG: pectate lyase [Calditrichaeota bacterium]|nr:MAG: pectate lyase [Calditrichota bacterium]
MISFILFLFISLFIYSVYSQPAAFPGAEGFGAQTSGGRGGAVIEVTNLKDDGPGSFRAAIETKGPRTIIFKISGNIILKSPLEIKNDSLTIAGQTAPGDGICLRDYPTDIEADNVIIRFLRFRLGDINKLPEDALSITGRKNIIIDHCSMSWGIDENASFYDNEKATVQWCMISESLHDSYHHKGKHGYGGIWGGKSVSFHHNLIAHNASRNPRFNGSRYHGQPDREMVDFRNNVIYNWGENSAYGGEGGQHNIIANYYKAGPASKHKNRIVQPWNNLGKWYIDGNYVYEFPDITADNWKGGVQPLEKIMAQRMEKPFMVPGPQTQNAECAFELVLKYCGAVLPKRDTVDERIVMEVKTGSATYGGKWGEHSGIIDSQQDVGGWPVLDSTEPPVDSDHDGMPDDWEDKNGLDKHNPEDRNKYLQGDGYTALEYYLNSLVELK